MEYKQAVILENPVVKMITVSLKGSQTYKNLFNHDILTVVLKSQQNSAVLTYLDRAIKLSQWDNFFIAKSTSFTIVNQANKPMQILINVYKNT